MITRILKNIPYWLEVLVTDVNGNGKDGLLVEYYIFRSSNNVLIEAGQMTNLSDGVYRKQITLFDLGQYRVIYKLPHRYADSIETIMVIEEVAKQATLNTHLEYLKRILGLTQENFRILVPTYDESHNLTSAKIRIYNNKTDCENDINVLAEYEVTATYNDGELISYKSKKV